MRQVFTPYYSHGRTHVLELVNIHVKWDSDTFHFGTLFTAIL
jgi:hypothetical protein